jgi:hypothetical protein
MNPPITKLTNQFERRGSLGLPGRALCRANCPSTPFGLPCFRVISGMPTMSRVASNTLLAFRTSLRCAAGFNQGYRRGDREHKSRVPLRKKVAGNMWARWGTFRVRCRLDSARVSLPSSPSRTTHVFRLPPVRTRSPPGHRRDDMTSTFVPLLPPSPSSSTSSSGGALGQLSEEELWTLVKAASQSSSPTTVLAGLLTSLASASSSSTSTPSTSSHPSYTAASLAPGHLRAFITAPPSSSSSAQQLAAAAHLFNSSSGDQEEDEDERLYTELLRDISLGDVDLGRREDYHHLLLHSPAPGCPEPGTAASSPLNGSDLLLLLLLRSVLSCLHRFLFCSCCHLCTSFNFPLQLFFFLVLVLHVLLSS